MPSDHETAREQRVEALGKMTRAEVNRVLALFPMDEFGTGHIADCGFDANDLRCDCSTLPERIADVLAEAKAEAWDEGARAVWQPLAVHAWSFGFYADDNPYRTTEASDD